MAQRAYLLLPVMPLEATRPQAGPGRLPALSRARESAPMSTDIASLRHAPPRFGMKLYALLFKSPTAHSGLRCTKIPIND